MKAFVFCFFVIAVIFIFVPTGKAQYVISGTAVNPPFKKKTIPLKNPSFEDTPAASSTLECWKNCGSSLDFPDIQPSPTFQIDKKPQHGNTYLGMVTHDTDMWEAITQKLETPLIGGECYNFSVYLARSESYLSSRKSDTTKIQFTQPVVLRIWGNNYCDKEELLAETYAIEHIEWKEYLFNLRPSRSYNFIMLEVFFMTPALAAYNGNLLIDNCSALTAVSCNSKTDSIQYINAMCEEGSSGFIPRTGGLSAPISHRANLNWSINRLVDSLKSYITLPESTRIKYLSAIGGILDKNYSFEIITKEEDKVQNAVNLLLNTKGIILDYNSSIRGLAKKTDDKRLIYLEQELRKINKDIANVEMMSLKERINNSNGLIEIGPMYEYRDSVANKIRENIKLKKEANRAFLKWQEVHNKLKKNEISIDIVRFNHSIDTIYRYSAAIISKNLPNPKFIHLGDEKTISPLLQTHENGQPKYLQNTLNRKELHKKIWQPLLPYLEDIKIIHISPAGLLHKVSFEALQDEKNEYLGEQFRFHYYSSMRDFVKEKPTNQSYKDAVLMGDILYDLEDKLQYKTEEWFTMRDERGKIRRLEATLEEVKDIHKTCDIAGVKSTMLTFDKATEDTVQYFSGERAPSILHFATHGLFLEPIDTSITGGSIKERLQSLTNPLQRSVLMLYGANHRWQKNEYAIGTEEDGILTALEVTALDLRKTDLVVLSACSTALGEVQHDTEGVFGLQRAFKLAGVDYVVASLWAVDDTATKNLMVLFYENLLQKKQDPATALRNAKDTLRKEGYLPKYWAAFILIE